MTPANIVQMAKLAELDIIAITDHNTVGNVRSAVKASELYDGPVIVPGMELETQENVHIVLLFRTVEDAEAAGNYVEELRFKIANKTEIYGRQLFVNEKDEITGEYPDLLVVNTEIGVYDAVKVAERFNGIAFPAHIDRPSNGILGILGNIDSFMGFSTVEISPLAPEKLVDEYKLRGYNIVSDSDAHNLADIGENGNAVLELDEVNVTCLIDALR